MQKVNYQNELEKIINSSKESKSLLLHVCCAPCSSYVLEYLSNFFEITVFYYNPNIEPYSEYEYRVNEEKRLIGEMNYKNPVHFIEGVYEPQEYHSRVAGLENEKEGGKRCEECFRLRLEKTAELCKEKNFDFFTTTLTLSPLKNADLLNAVGQKAAEKYGVEWLPCDFKKKNGYLRSIELSKQHNLYRQNYCGCIYSK